MTTAEDSLSISGDLLWTPEMISFFGNPPLAGDDGLPGVGIPDLNAGSFLMTATIDGAMVSE